MTVTATVAAPPVAQPVAAAVAASVAAPPPTPAHAQSLSDAELGILRGSRCDAGGPRHREDGGGGGRRKGGVVIGVARGLARAGEAAARRADDGDGVRVLARKKV